MKQGVISMCFYFKNITSDLLIELGAITRVYLDVRFLTKNQCKIQGRKLLLSGKKLLILHLLIEPINFTPDLAQNHRKISVAWVGLEKQTTSMGPPYGSITIANASGWNQL